MHDYIISNTLMSVLIREQVSSDTCVFPLRFLELNNFADHSWTRMAGVPGGLYRGSIPYHGELPSEQKLPLQKYDGEGSSASMCFVSVVAMLA